MSGLFFTTPDAKLIVHGEGNQLQGIPQERIVREALSAAHGRGERRPVK